MCIRDRERTLSLVRDRFGIKPLHYTRQSHGLIFASELKSLRVVPGFSFVVDRNVLGSFVQKSYVPGVQTIYRSVFRVPPGHILTVRLDDLSAELQSQPYWSLPPISKHTSTRIDLPEQICVLDSLLRDAVSLRLLSDVPVGLFLSGGIDSSLVSAIAQNVSNVSLNTYSIGFDDKLYDEAAHAKKVAQVLGTNHLEMRLSERDVLDVVPMLPQVYDEPFGDSSQIPTMLLCSLARRHVTVALSGDGGDEMFAGYDRYFLAQRIWSLRKSLSAVGAAALGTAVTLAPVRLWDVMADVSRPFLPPRLRKPEFGSRVHRFANSLNSDDFASLYRSLTTRWNGLDSPVVLGAQGNIEKGDFHSCRQTELMDMMTRVDIGDFLPNDILTKLDRASMAVGLEARVPLLDHRVAEFAMKLPVEAKIKNGQSKLILRQLLQKYIPAEVWDRPKQGFNIPLTRWLRGPLRNWATALLDPVRINSEGFFDAAPIIFRWKEHLTGKRDWSPEIWNILMFQAWLEFNHPEQARN